MNLKNHKDLIPSLEATQTKDAYLTTLRYLSKPNLLIPRTCEVLESMGFKIFNKEGSYKHTWEIIYKGSITVVATKDRLMVSCTNDYGADRTVTVSSKLIFMSYDNMHDILLNMINQVIRNYLNDTTEILSNGNSAKLTSMPLKPSKV